MGTLVRIGIDALDFLFVTGLVGSVAVIVLTGIQDSKAFEKELDEKAPGQA
ncbi:MAG: hypothetical protein ACE14L_00415 [Terriglobales bacterium]